MKIFIDFDDVLFNTKQFVEDIKKIFEKNGVSEAVFRKYYREQPKKGDEKVRKYNPYEQIKRIKDLGIETKGIERDFGKLLKNTSKYSFRDGIKFLKEFKNEDLYIVSFGNRKFQGEKINNSGIGKYIREILIIEASKAVGIKRILRRRNLEPGEALIFLDDRVKFLKDIKKSYPGMVTFLMKRKEGRYDDERTKYCDFEVENFNEASEIIKDGK
jgi:FMN phosphatase YigB (HAD superfamily)